MPLARRPTPPYGQVKQSNNVIDSLDTWANEQQNAHRLSELAPGPMDGYHALHPSDDDKLEGTKVVDRLDVDGEVFNLFFGGVICANAAVLGLETDLGNGDFVILEHIFNAIFLVELGLRIACQGKHYLDEKWNWFDFAVVSLGSLDLWVLPLFVHDGTTGSHVSLIRVVRLIRLVRVIRLLRIFRLSRKLVLILQAFGKSFEVVLLFAAIVVIIDYILAILLTQYFGHHSRERFGEELGMRMEDWFGTIGSSMQTLAVIMTLSSWDKIALAMIEGGVPAPMVCISFVGYIGVTWYTSLSLILGITTNSLTSSRCEFQINLEDDQDAARKALAGELTNFLMELFEDEQDGQGRVPTVDIKQAVRSDKGLPDKLTKLGVSLDEKGIIKLLDKLSSEGRVSIQYFIDKVTNLNRFASAASVVDLKYDVTRAQARIASINRLVDALAERYDVLRGVVSDELVKTAFEEKRREVVPPGDVVAVGSSLKGGHPDRNKTNLKVQFSEEAPFYIEPLTFSVARTSM